MCQVNGVVAIVCQRSAKCAINLNDQDSMADFVHVAYNFCPNDGYKYLKFEKKCPLCSFDRTKAEEGVRVVTFMMQRANT